MSYMHIENLYKATEILMFRECYAMEKIHGTSAHITYKSGRVNLFAGGGSHDEFVKLFDKEDLKRRFAEMIPGDTSCIVYGESYGGKTMKMSKMYGPDKKFICFEVKIGDSWLNVPNAEDVVIKLGLEFVHYEKVPTDIDLLEQLKDVDSVQAIRNGMGEGHPREGIVLRPLVEVVKNNGNRIIAKHKADWSKETKTPRKLDAAKLKVLQEANDIADEWVTIERINHVLDAIALPLDVTNIGKIIPAMIEDIEREGKDEVVMSSEAKKAIGKVTALTVKRLLSSALKEKK